jgi:hypothetical protein
VTFLRLIFLALLKALLLSSTLSPTSMPVKSSSGPIKSSEIYGNKYMSSNPKLFLQNEKIYGVTNYIGYYQDK